MQSSAKDEEQSSVSAKARAAAQSFKEIVKSVVKKTKAVTEEKNKLLRL